LLLLEAAAAAAAAFASSSLFDSAADAKLVGFSYSISSYKLLLFLCFDGSCSCYLSFND
jgi:hypothetical protein